MIGISRPRSFPPATNVRWQIFGLSCATSWTLYLHRYTFGIIMPTLADEWHVSLPDLGFMQSAFYAAYVRCKFRRGSWSIGFAHLFLGTILLLWSGVLALHASAPDRAAMYWVRVLFGITQAAAIPRWAR